MPATQVNRKTLVYSTTRQWNPGDEFILFGCRNILTAVYGEHNAVIYNRNPDVRLYRDGSLRADFFDNSVKYTSDLRSADLAILAGTPEWWQPITYNFYEHVLKSGIPLIGLGLGSMPNEQFYPYIQEVLAHSPLLTVRDANLLKSIVAQPYDFIALPCPALLSVPIGGEKSIDRVKSIGLILGLPSELTIVNQYISKEAHDNVYALLKSLIEEYKADYDFTLIAHYIDELEAYRSLFPELPIQYSYDAKDYIGIYRDYDLIISTRVHGNALASSLGIPNINFSHDFRGDTVRQFMSKQFYAVNADYEAAKCTFEEMANSVSALNKSLIEYKRTIFDKYLELIAPIEIETFVNYNYTPIEYRQIAFNSSLLSEQFFDIKHSLKELNSAVSRLDQKLSTVVT